MSHNPMQSCSTHEPDLVKSAFGESGLGSRRLLRRHLADCPECRKRFHEYRQMAKALSRMKQPKCPEGCLQHVLQKTTPASRSQVPASRLLIQVLGRKPLRPIIITVMVAVIALFAARFKQGMNKTGYSQAEITQAKYDAMTALGLLGKVIEKTQQSLDQQVLPERVFRPIKKSIESAIKPLRNGG